ncbi:MAG: hypothetical protein ACRDPY_25735 [Streptosporangiaceae bacterium]
MPDNDEPATSKERLVQLLHDLRGAKENAAGCPLTLTEIAKRIHARRCRIYKPGDLTPRPKKPPAVSTLWGVFNGVRTSPELVYDLVRELGGTHERGLRAQELVELIRANPAARPRQKQGDIAGPRGRTLDAVVACLNAARSRGTETAGKDKLRLAAEIALGRAIARYATSDGRIALAGPLLRPDGFLAQSEIAGILAAALIGRDTDPHPLGQAWAEAFLAGTRVRDLTQDAVDLLGYIRNEGGQLKPLRALRSAAGPHEPARPALDDEPESGKRTTATALEQAASKVRAELAGVARMMPAGAAMRDLPPRVRVHLYDQTALMTAATEGFTGREFVFRRLTEFIEQDGSGYCFVQAYPGVGKTALLASFVVAHPHYARHFNVLTAGVTSPDRFLKNICAQLIGTYGLPYDRLPGRAAYDNGFLVEVLDRAAHAAGRQKVVVVVIDALDEALTRGRLPGVNPLYLPRSLPDGCRFIVTVRKDTDGWEPTLDPGCRSVPVLIDEHGQENMDDVRAYIRSRAEQEGVRAYLWSRRLSVEDFAGILAEKSEGNFMYLRHILPEYEEHGALTDGELAKLPVGLVRYYKDQVERMKGADVDAWFTLRFPVLTVLAKARRPLTVAEITVLAGQDSTHRVLSVVREWLQFLVPVQVTRDGGPRTGYRIFHASFKEFLLKETEEAAQAGTDVGKVRDLDDEARRRFLDDDLDENDESGQDG